MISWVKRDISYESEEGVMRGPLHDCYLDVAGEIMSLLDQTGHTKGTQKGLGMGDI
jgi:hypothetical protein